jgi:purine-cytosine permease-like protein
VAVAGFVLMPVLAVVWGVEIGSPFMWVFENVQAPMQSTVFALLAFFVASASYRGFRARSVPAAILLGAALIILISRSALGGWLASWLPEVADWMRNNPAMSARRAILIGIGLGSLTTSLRVILGIERTWLGSES